MAIYQIFQFLQGASRLAKLDPTTAFPPLLPEQYQYHQVLVRCGKIGACVGVLAGIGMAYEMYIHPNHPDGSHDFGMIIFAPFMLIAAGILAGTSWAGLFAPAAFLNGPVGAHWMKFSGAKSPTGARIVAVLMALLTTGVFVFLPICVAIGKV